MTHRNGFCGENASFVFWDPLNYAKKRFFSSLLTVDGAPHTEVYRGVSYAKFKTGE